MLKTTDPESSAARHSAAAPDVAATEVLLARVDQTVTRLFALVSEALVGATAAVLEQDHELGRLVIVGDQVIDDLTAHVEQSIWEVIRRDALDATGFRYAVVILLVLPELERSADLAEHIAQRALTDLGGEMTPASRGLVQRMSDVASAMWNQVTVAYLARSACGAELDEADEELDLLHERLSDDVATGDMIPSVAAQVTLLSRFYERLGDHAVNLARRLEALHR
jgi:phosphate transport system protein